MKPKNESKAADKIERKSPILGMTEPKIKAERDMSLKPEVFEND